MRHLSLFISTIIMLILFAGCSFGQNKAEGLPESITREVKNTNLIVSGKYTPVTVWEAEAKTFTHRVGHETSDPQASNGKAWTAFTDKDGTGHIIYGPYVKMQPGDYAAFFRIKLLDDAGTDEDLGVIDAASNNGASLLQAYSLTPADLQYGKYVQMPLTFRYTGGPLECRMSWTGVASVSLDNVTLYRLEGGNPAESVQQIQRIPQVQPTGKPNDLSYSRYTLPPKDLFPVSKTPASTLDYMDISNLAPDWQLLLQSLQGIVNRDKPVIYLKTCPQDGFWMDWVIKQRWIKSTNKITDPMVMIKKYMSKINGVVITDPALASTKNIATMIAGVENVIAASPRLAAQLNLPIKEDLRGKFQNDAQGYRWAFDNLWSKMNHNLAACLWPHANGVRDYLVENKVFIFWIPGPIDGAKKTSAPQEQMKFVEELLSKMPANTPIMGYSYAGVDVGIGEGGGVGLMAEYAKFLVGSISTANISVHSGFTVPPFKQRKSDPAPKMQNDKTYITLVISDGDNIPVITTSNWPQVWKNDMRGKFPVSWTISPSSCQLIPDIMNYYYTTATKNDTFMAAVSGVGYTYPTLYAKRYNVLVRKAVFDDFLDRTRDYMDRMNLTTINPSSVGDQNIRRYAELIPELKAIFPDYGKVVTNYDEATRVTIGDIPVFHAVTSWDPKGDGEKQIENLVTQIKEITPKQKPAFMHVFICNWFWDLPTIKKALDRLGPDYIPVAPEQLAELSKQEMEKQQIHTRISPVTIGLEGEPVTISVPVQNISSELYEVKAQPVSGLERYSISPRNMILPPGEEVVIDIKGVPTADKVTIEVNGTFKTKTYETRIRLVHKSELTQPLPMNSSLVPIRLFEAEVMPHNTGTKEADPNADSGYVESAIKGKSLPGHLAYGPYVYMEPGKYVAIFRVKRLGEGSGTVATLDAAVGGSITQSAVMTVTADMLPVDEYREVPLVFNHPGGLLETRLFWNGNASLALDSISLWSVN